MFSSICCQNILYPLLLKRLSYHLSCFDWPPSQDRRTEYHRKVTRMTRSPHGELSIEPGLYHSIHTCSIDSPNLISSPSVEIQEVFRLIVMSSVLFVENTCNFVTSAHNFTWYLLQKTINKPALARNYQHQTNKTVQTLAKLSLIFSLSWAK